MKLTKKLTVTLLTLALVLGCVPCTTTEVQAAPKVHKKHSFYLMKWPCGNAITVEGLSKSQKIAKSSLKSSNSGVIRMEKISYYKNKKLRNASLQFSIKKPGTSIISFKIGNKKYQTKIIARKYVNPVKSLVIPGIKDGNKTNLANLSSASKYGTIVSSLKPTKSTKNAKIQIEAKKGWKIQSTFGYNMDAIIDPQIKIDPNEKASFDQKYKNPVSKASARIDIKKDSHYSIYVRFINAKTKTVIVVNYYINYWPDIMPSDAILADEYLFR